MMASDTKSLEAKCHCGLVNFELIVPVTALPVAAYLCHCSLCRYQSGAPCIFHCNIPKGGKLNFIAPSSWDKMSNRSDEIGGWYFCGTCGAHVLTTDEKHEATTLSNSIFVNHSPELVKIKQQVFTKSAKGGGIAEMCSRMHGEEVKAWNPPPSSESARVVESKPETGPDGEPCLRAECLCGGVSFTIRRPDKAVLEDEFLRGFVSPHDKTKWRATMDVCDDCRLVNGTHCVGWMFFSLACAEPRIRSDLKIGTMKTYESSPGCVRSFCGECSATFFYSCADRTKPDGRQAVDLATGVLRAPEGVMAENWLGWRSRLGFVEDGKAFDRGFTEALEQGMKKWVVDHYGEEVEYQVGSDNTT